MRKVTLWLIPILLAAGIAILVSERKSTAPQVAFAKTTRETISNILSTNGKVEPLSYMDVRVELRGLVKRVAVHLGDTVKKGQVIAEISQPGLREEIEGAEAREAQARADLQTLQGGGPSAQTADIDASLSRLKSDRAAAQKTLESLQRLQQKQAATAFEVDQAKQAVQSIDVQIQGLEHRRGSIVGSGDLAAAKAKLEEAQASVRLAKSHTSQGVITAPMAGTVYDLPARAGAFLNPGDPVASIGVLNPARVRVYVDEPELGRVAPGEKVRITWDALPGKEWYGTVEKRPSEVIALGTRQVGEVLCTIDNEAHELVPGTNINAFILTQVVENALTIPKEAVRRDNGIGVFVLQPDSTVKWQPVRTGASDALRVEVVSGLKDGDEVAEPSDVPLKNGMKVLPPGT
ncbi:MAG TPA: efflux RND transporter periplasmic adaptor subunit [Bryobacteraceae bacterium]|nr:efflux RND transporter periplasmic adaptor subunit [Bryobacteraceae bacterium]